MLLYEPAYEPILVHLCFTELYYSSLDPTSILISLSTARPRLEESYQRSSASGIIGFCRYNSPPYASFDFFFLLL